MAYIRDLNLPPIRFIQFVPRFVPRCRLYSFIISIWSGSHTGVEAVGNDMPGTGDVVVSQPQFEPTNAQGTSIIAPSFIRAVGASNSIASPKVLVPAEIFQFSDMHYETERYRDSTDGLLYFYFRRYFEVS